MEHAVNSHNTAPEEKSTLAFGSEKALLDYYREGYNTAQRQRSDNDHRSALSTFQHLQRVVAATKARGIDSFEIQLKEATLHFATTECFTILQYPPDDVMREYHQFGKILIAILRDITSADSRFESLGDVLHPYFTATDIDSLADLMDELGSIHEEVEIETLHPEQRVRLGMFYFFMTKYIEAIQDFFIFSTKHAGEAHKCVPLFKEAAQMTLRYFENTPDDDLENQNLGVYKKYSQMWFEFYDKVIEAKLALYVHSEFGDAKLALGSPEEKKLHLIIDANLEKADEIKKHIREYEEKGNLPPAKLDQERAEALSAAEHAMEILVEMYATDALMNLEYYQDAISELQRILIKTGKLDNPHKVQFKANLNIARVARKHLIDFMFNPDDIDQQLLPMCQQADRQVEMPFNIQSLPDTEETGVFDFGRADTVYAGDLIPEHVHRVDEQKFYNSFVDEWELRIKGDFQIAFQAAKKLLPAQGGESHLVSKEMALIEARFRLTKDLLALVEPCDLQGDAQTDVAVLTDSKNPGMYRALRRLKIIEQSIASAIPSKEQNGIHYYRQVAEALIVRANLGISRIRLYTYHDEEKEIIDAEYRTVFENLCTAHTILMELEEQNNSTVLGNSNMAAINEIHYLYERLTDLQPDTTEEVQGTRFAVTANMRAVSRNYKQQVLTSDFNCIVEDPGFLAAPKGFAAYRDGLRGMLRKHISYVTDIELVEYPAEYDEFFEDDVYEENYYGCDSQYITLFRLSPESRAAFEIISKIQLTPQEKEMVKITIRNFQRHIAGHST